MVRLLCLALAVAACGTTDDNRPLEANYIAEAIMAPTCGAAQCHSTFRQAKGDVFDTLDGFRHSIVDNGLVVLDSLQFDPADPADSALVTWVTKIDPFGLGIGRMPFDAPMPNSDVHLLERWITGPTKIRDDKTACSKTVACPQADDICQYAQPGDTTGNCVNITYLAPAHGAQCNPKKGNACFGKQLFPCTSDWNFDLGHPGQICPSDCSAGVCL